MACIYETNDSPQVTCNPRVNTFVDRYTGTRIRMV